jgi:hypothetical protein
MFTITGEAILLNTGFFPRFVFPSDQHINIDLLLSGQQVDNFFADTTWVDKRRGKQISFQKIITPTKAIVSSSREGVKNVDDEKYAANPWDIIERDDEESPADYAIPIPPKPIRNPKCDEQEVAEQKLTISEIFRGGSGTDFEPYIEFFVHEDRLTEDYIFLFLSGSLLKTGLQLNRNEETDVYDPRDVEKNTRLLLTKKEGHLSDAAVLTLLYHKDFELDNSS